MYTQALEATDYEYGTLRDSKWVASKIEMSCRHDNLSFEHHRQVAPLEPEDQNIVQRVGESLPPFFTDSTNSINNVQTLQAFYC